MQEVSGSIPLTSTRKRTPSSRGLGHRPFTAVTGVRIPVGSPNKMPPARWHFFWRSHAGFEPPVRQPDVRGTSGWTRAPLNPCVDALNSLRAFLLRSMRAVPQPLRGKGFIVRRGNANDEQSPWGRQPDQQVGVRLQACLRSGSTVDTLAAGSCACAERRFSSSSTY